MNREELLRNLKQVREKEKDRKYSVGQLNVFDMVSDVINYLEHEEKPKITNLEYYKDEINDLIEKYGLGQVHKKIRYAFEVFSEKHIDNYPHEADKFVDWLLEEHKEPIKLKKWEYDLIKHYAVIKRFDGGDTLMAMRSKGHFKGITDTSMKIKDILNNCIIVSDDYEGFEDCK